MKKRPDHVFHRPPVSLCVALIVSCPGLEMAWVVRPPEMVKSGEVFSVVYSVTVPDGFYLWAVENHIFTHRFSMCCLLHRWLSWSELVELVELVEVVWYLCVQLHRECRSSSVVL